MSCADICEPQTNVDSFDNAKTKLLGLSLIRTIDETGHISFYRLTQAAFFDRMSEHQREKTFKVALSLLHKGFPGREGHHHLYTRWQTCEQLRQHVLAFQTQYEILRKAIPSWIAVRDQVPQDLLCLQILARNPVVF